MNQKALRYVLIAAVVFVWGAILFQVFAAIGSDDKPQTSLVLGSQTLSLNFPDDSFALVGHYPDPFLPKDGMYEEGAATSDSSQSMTRIVSNQSASVVLPVAPTIESVDISFIKYSGMIANPEKKIVVAIVNIRGKDVLLKEHETVDELTLRKISAEKAFVRYKNRNFAIPRTKN